MRTFIKLVFFIVLAQSISAQTTYTWTGASIVNDNASQPANWGNILSTAVPGAADNVVFNATDGTSCIWDLATINNLSVLTGYTGVITMGTAQRIITGNLLINAATVVATSGSLSFSGTGSSNFNLGASGTFSNNGGTVVVSEAPGQAFTFSGNLILSQLTFIGTGATTARNINFGSNLISTGVTFNTGSPVASSCIHSFQGSIHIKNSLSIGASAYTSVPPGNTANFIFDGASATISGASALSQVPLPNIEINTAGSVSMSNQINVTGNWTGTKGTLTAGTSIVNLYGTSASITGTASAFDNLTIQAGASVTFPSSANVELTKNFTNNGTLTIPVTNVLSFNGGTTGQTISGTGFTAGSIYAKSGSRTITLTTPVSISDSLKLESNVTFATGGNLTLSSGSALKGRVAQLGTSASVSGNVKVETFIPGGTTGWVNMGVSGVTGQTIANWDTYFSSGAANGIPMTCTGCTYAQTATGGHWFNSIAAWNESIQYYDTLVTASTSLATGKGFWVYVGDGFSSTNNLKLVNTGPLVQNGVSIGLTSTTGTNGAKGMNLVSNPYASPIGWSKVLAASGGTSTGLTNAIYVWNADLSTTTSFVNGVASSGSGITNVIPAGQGFYVETTAATNLVFSESVKVSNNTSANPLLRTTSTNDIGQVFHLKLKGQYDQDEMAFRVHPDATDSFDVNLDAHKIFQSPGYEGYPGPYTKYTSISSKDPFNEDYSVHSIPSLTQTTSIPLLIKVSTSGTYTIEGIETNNIHDCILLKDKLVNATQDLKGANYIFTIKDTTSAPRFELIFCRDSQLNLVSVNELEKSNLVTISQDLEGAYVKTNFSENTKATISAYTILGQKLIQDTQIEGTTTTTHLNLDVHNQVVFIKVTSDKGSNAKKMVIH